MHTGKPRLQANSKVDVVYTCDRRSIDVREAYDVIERARRVSSTGRGKRHQCRAYSASSPLLTRPVSASAYAHCLRLIAGFSLHCTLDGRSTGLVELGPEERAGVLRYLETHSSSERVALGLANSHWVVGALAWEDDVSALRVARGETSSVQRQASRSVDSFLGCVMRRRRRQLVGLARAISDVGLVATVEVVVDPDLHGLGIGSGLTAQLTRQISSTGYEVRC